MLSTKNILRYWLECRSLNTWIWWRNSHPAFICNTEYLVTNNGVAKNVSSGSVVIIFVTQIYSF
jgi:hypothetical protein